MSGYVYFEDEDGDKTSIRPGDVSAVEPGASPRGSVTKIPHSIVHLKSGSKITILKRSNDVIERLGSYEP